MFSVANAVLLAPLPYRAPEQLATLWTEVPTQNIREGRSAYLDVEQWRRETKRISEMAVFDPVFGDAYEFVGAEHISAVRTSPNLFPPLGVQPLHGRSFSAEEAERGEAVAVISHRFWQMRFAAPQAAIGASVELDGARSGSSGSCPQNSSLRGSTRDVWNRTRCLRTCRADGRGLPVHGSSWGDCVRT
jgi:hypothetical protein